MILSSKDWAVVGPNNWAGGVAGRPRQLSVCNYPIQWTVRECDEGTLGVLGG